LTLTELAVAMTVAGILLAAGYGIFLSQQKTYAIQDRVVEIQQNARVAINFMGRDLRMAGHGRPDSPVTINGETYQDAVKVDADKAGMTLLGCFGVPEGFLSRTALPGDTHIELVDASEFAKTDWEDRKYIFVGEYDKAVITHIDGNTLTLSRKIRKRYPTSRLRGGVEPGVTRIRVDDTSHIYPGDILTLGDERLYVTATAGDVIDFDTDPTTPSTADALVWGYPSRALVNPIPVYRVQVLRYYLDGEGALRREDVAGHAWKVAEKMDALKITPPVSPDSPTYRIELTARTDVPDEAGRNRSRTYAFTVRCRNR
jgi:hypothetical protein